MMKSTRFNIVVVHRNGREKIINFLLSADRAINSEIDLITVVDNHSTDDSIIFCKNAFPSARIIKNAFNYGYAYACNQGIKSIDSKYVLICNNDITLTPQVLDQIEKRFEIYPNAALISPQLINSNGEKVISAGDLPTFISELGWKRKNKKIYQEKDFIKVESVIGACMALRRNALSDFDLLDEEFYFYYEETEWHHRINQSKWSIYLDSNIEIRHLGGASSKKIYWQTRVEYFRSRLLFWKKVFSKREYLILFAYHALKSCIDLTYYCAINIFTLGLHKKMRSKLIDRFFIISWLLTGRPSHWGLPDKPH